MNKGNQVAIAMSGGVDSGVSAALLVGAGYDVAGFHMRLFEKDTGWESAQKTAKFLKIPIQKVDLTKIFKKRVIDYFLKVYAKGLTPNPCVMCNKYIKFGELFDYVRKLGFDYLATGHYARISDGHLLTARDKTKDQTYFLYNLEQEQLAHILFPVGDLTKKEVRAMARRWKLPVAQRPESQEICFLPEDDYRPFLKRQIAKNIQSGEVVDVKGRVIGRHNGLPLYTIGQRHGFRLDLKKTLPPYYVISKKPANNQLTVGFGKETEKKEFKVDQVSLVSAKGGPSPGWNQVNPGDIKDLRVRVRSQGELLKCQINKYANKQIKVTLKEPERGIAPGQVAVLYKKWRMENGEWRKNNFEVLGGGIIQ